MLQKLDTFCEKKMSGKSTRRRSLITWALRKKYQKNFNILIEEIVFY